MCTMTKISSKLTNSFSDSVCFFSSSHLFKENASAIHTDVFYYENHENVTFTEANNSW